MSKENKKVKKQVKKKVKKQRKKRTCTVSEHKQIEFARLYFISKDKNATVAYIEAGFAEKGAAGNASRMLKKPIVKKELTRLAASQEERLNIKADEILKELLVSAKSDIRELFDENGFVKNPNEWPDEIAKSVSSIKIEEIKVWNEKKRIHENVGFNKHVKLWDKTKSLELLGKHLKLFQETLNVNVTTDLITRMEQGRKRTILDE